MASADRFVPSGIVTLTTDFGTRDGYVGAMKGVLLTRAPDLAIVDVAHEVGPQDVAHGAAVLRTACRYYPEGTVHVGVVDPGVGTERAGVVVLAGGHAFVGPDNGLFAWAAASLGGVAEARRIDPTGALAPFVPETPSATFHGRDVFAPTAAALASGRVALADVGPPHRPVPLALPPLEPDGDAVAGCITHVDRFGNAITNVPAARLPDFPGRAFEVTVGDRRLDVVLTYGSVAEGVACALAGSEGFVEIAVRGGDAARELGLSTGAPVRVAPRPDR